MNQTVPVREQFSKTARVGQIACNCHDCEPMFTEAVKPLLEMIELRPNNELLQWVSEILPDFVEGKLNVPLDFQVEVADLSSRIARITRVTANHGKAFFGLEAQLVHIPFLGVAVFAANVVHQEARLAARVYLLARLVQVNPNLSTNLLPVPFHMKHLLNHFMKVGLGEVRRLILHIINGNLAVFIEVFPVFTFCIEHFKKYGRPRGAAIDDFQECLTRFRDFWAGAIKEMTPYFCDIPGFQKPKVRVDREGLGIDGIILCLRDAEDHKNILNGGILIATNEQTFTLQEYMYDRIDYNFLPILRGNLDFDDPFYAFTLVKQAKLYFSADLDDPDRIPEQYVTPFEEGNVTEVADRMAFTVKVINKFYDMHYFDAGNRSYMSSHQRRLTS